jgi:hypothetical protein
VWFDRGCFDVRRRRNGRFPPGAEKYQDESFVLPALLRFNGEPFVDDDGRLLYKFPDLQVGDPVARIFVGGFVISHVFSHIYWVCVLSFGHLS